MTEYISEGSGDDANGAINAIIKGNTTNYSEAKEIDYYMQPMLSKNWKVYIDGANTIDTIYQKDSSGVYYRPWYVAKYVFDHALTPGIFKFGKVERTAKAKDNSPVSKIDMTPYLFI